MYKRQSEDSTRPNTRRLTVDDVVEKLLRLDYVKKELSELGR